MKKMKVTVPWPEGLHLRPAARVARVARGFRAKIFLRFGSRVADAGSTLSLIVLCATLNAPLEIEAVGDDEQDAVQAIACCFDAQLAPPSAKTADHGAGSPRNGGNAKAR
jgi:phosphotransferase system HPr (HPr) family protein